MTPLLKANLPELTIPEKPTGSRQKYRITAKGQEHLARNSQVFAATRSIRIGRSPKSASGDVLAAEFPCRKSGVLFEEAGKIKLVVEPQLRRDLSGGHLMQQ